MEFELYALPWVSEVPCLVRLVAWELHLFMKGRGARKVWKTVGGGGRISCRYSWGTQRDGGRNGVNTDSPCSMESTHVGSAAGAPAASVAWPRRRGGKVLCLPALCL